VRVEVGARGYSGINEITGFVSFTVEMTLSASSAASAFTVGAVSLPDIRLGHPRFDPATTMGNTLPDSSADSRYFPAP